MSDKYLGPSVLALAATFGLNLLILYGVTGSLLPQPAPVATQPGQLAPVGQATPDTPAPPPAPAAPPPPAAPPEVATETTTAPPAEAPPPPPAAAEDSPPAEVAAAAPRSGEEVYNGACIACHASGAAGAPIVGDHTAWAPRIAKGMETLLQHAINGFNIMPPRGTCATCSDAELQAAIEYMVGKSQGP